MPARTLRHAATAVVAAGVLAAGVLVVDIRMGEAQQTRPATPATRPQATPAPPPSGLDLAFGAYQRGHFLTALKEATERIERSPDAAAMTLIGELYANGYGVAQDDARALGWYRLAAERGDRNAIFALGMAHVEGRGGVARDPGQARTFFERAGQMGHPAAAYNLGIMAMSGQIGGQPNPGEAARWFEIAANAGSSDAQFALGVLLKDGNGIARDLPRAAELMRLASAQDLPEALIEYGIMLFNGQGVLRDETAGARQFRRAADRGNPIAMNRFARLLATGRGVQADPVRAARLHLMARAFGAEDQWMTDFVARLEPAQREEAERAVRAWLQ